MDKQAWMQRRWTVARDKIVLTLVEAGMGWQDALVEADERCLKALLRLNSSED